MKCTTIAVHLYCQRGSHTPAKQSDKGKRTDLIICHSSFTPLPALLPPLCHPRGAHYTLEPGTKRMESRAKETQEFMNVDSFSQLPFLRPAHARQKGIRLFGIDCTREPPAAASDSTVSQGGEKDAPYSEDAGRRFECHYCYRNFPTSQALGGHQNAHKRERQHAKRAHLQSALSHTAGYSSRHVYGLIDYHVDSKVRPLELPHDRTCSGRVCGGHVLASQPINGNPLPGLWRIPAVGRNGRAMILDLGRSSVVPMQRVESRATDRLVYGGGGGGGFGAHEHVSLDLRL